jgi:hypothetical protein
VAVEQNAIEEESHFEARSVREAVTKSVIAAGDEREKGEESPSEDRTVARMFV